MAHFSTAVVGTDPTPPLRRADLGTCRFALALSSDILAWTTQVPLDQLPGKE
jgi:hypothetical protein